MNKKIYFISGVLFLSILPLVIIILKTNEYDSKVVLPSQAPPRLVAHAGGTIEGHLFTNSREALDRSFSLGYQLIETDFSWSKDRNLVLVHDWRRGYRRLFGQKRIPTENQFLSQKILGRYTTLSIAGLIDWLNRHPSVKIVTDIKSHNLKALAEIAYKYPASQQRFIPQIYKFSEYDAVSKLGYKNIILTLYILRTSDFNILKFAAAHHLFALTMPVRQAMRSTLALSLSELGIYVYANTVNDWETFRRLSKRKIRGIYTDVLFGDGKIKQPESINPPDETIQ